MRRDGGRVVACRIERTAAAGRQHECASSGQGVQGAVGEAEQAVIEGGFGRRGARFALAIELDQFAAAGRTDFYRAARTLLVFEGTCQGRREHAEEESQHDYPSVHRAALNEEIHPKIIAQRTGAGYVPSPGALRSLASAESRSWYRFADAAWGN